MHATWHDQRLRQIHLQAADTKLDIDIYTYAVSAIYAVIDTSRYIFGTHIYTDTIAKTDIDTNIGIDTDTYAATGMQS